VADRWTDRGFGFIKPDDGGDDVFCHVSAIKDGNALPEGGRVHYNLTYDDRRGKDCAADVTGTNIG
jgi:cold shock CspA family protein